MAEMKRMEKEVMLNELFRYVSEERDNKKRKTKCSIEQAYEELGVPEDMRMTVIEIIEFLYPADTTEKSLEELIIEHITDKASSM